MDTKMRILNAEERYENSRDGYTASLAAFSEPSKRETQEYSVKSPNEGLDKVEELSHRLNARIHGLAWRESANCDEPPQTKRTPEQPSQRKREGWPICYKGRHVGHIQYNGYFYQPEVQYHIQGRNHEQCTNYDQEGNQQSPGRQSGARLYALDALYAHSSQNFNHKTENPGPEAQTSSRPAHLQIKSSRKINLERSGCSRPA